jgi:hypothetical protein
MTDKDEQPREAAGKGTKQVGQILVDLQLEAEGKLKKNAEHAETAPETPEQKPEDDR